VAGVHGKSTTTAIVGTLLAAAGLPAKILAGSAAANFGGRSTISVGDRYFVAETCEYRKHFLKFHPRRILLTSVESDHQDFFPTYESILSAFVEYGGRLASGGELIYCADDAGAREVAALLGKKRDDIRYTPYGFDADGAFGITDYASGDGESRFEMSGIPCVWTVRVPGRHNVQNSAGAIALVKSIADAEARAFDGEMTGRLSRALEGFAGCKRRSEIIGEAGGILFMDDYAHHPTALRTTLAGLRQFYPKRRLVASFMPHTYSRTSALLPDFARSFESADVVFLHKIYASAREVYDGQVTGRLLFEKTAALHRDVRYVDEPLDAQDELKSILREGDLFITLGAGDNWKLGEALFRHYGGVVSA
jgi:UDP-N-acetylmuramate--alanine ligase